MNPFFFLILFNYKKIKNRFNMVQYLYIELANRVLDLSGPNQHLSVYLCMGLSHDYIWKNFTVIIKFIRVVYWIYKKIAIDSEPKSNQNWWVWGQFRKWIKSWFYTAVQMEEGIQVPPLLFTFFLVHGWNSEEVLSKWSLITK